MACGLTICSRLSKEDVHNGDVALIGVVIGYLLKNIDPSMYTMNQTLVREVMSSLSPKELGKFPDANAMFALIYALKDDEIEQYTLSSVFQLTYL